MSIPTPLIWAFLFTTFTTLSFYFGFNNKPWRGLWSIYMLIFLTCWAAIIWFNFPGSHNLTLAWVPSTLIGVIFTILIEGVFPTHINKSPKKNATKLPTLLYWIIVIGLLIAIIIRYNSMHLTQETLRTRILFMQTTSHLEHFLHLINRLTFRF